MPEHGLSLTATPPFSPPPPLPCRLHAVSGELMRAVLSNLDLDAIDFPFKASP